MKKVKNIFFIFIIFFIAINSLKIVRWFYPVKYMDQILEYSAAYGVDPYIVMSIIKVESNFNSNAVSHKKATGLMQITEGTSLWISSKLDIDNYDYSLLKDPSLNIKMGSFYISYLLEMYEGRLECALAAYNAGFNNVDKWLADSEYSKDGRVLSRVPYPETERYIDKVKNNYKIYKFLYRGAVKKRQAIISSCWTAGQASLKK